MKNIKYAAAALILSTLSFGAFAAQSVSASDALRLDKVGVVSAEGASTLDGLESKLAAKADAAGASAYVITSANTDGRMNGTAIIYK